MLYITGITGHSGRWFFEKLKSEKFSEKIICLVRSNSDTSFMLNSGLDIEIVYGDLNDFDCLKTTMTNVDTVIHIASIRYSLNVVKSALLNNVKWVVLVHTTGIYSKFRSASTEYIDIESKILKLRNKIGVTIIRPTMIYGSCRDRNMHKLINYLYKHKFFPIFGKGNNLMQPVHAKDLGYAYYDVFKNKNKTFNKEYNLPGKHELKYVDIIKIVSRFLGTKTLIIKVPMHISLICAKIYNAISKNAVIKVEQVLRMSEDKAFEYKDAERDFKYCPVAFESGIKDEIAEYLSSL